MVPVSAPVSVAPTSSAPRDVTPDIRDVTPDRSRDVTPTRAEKPRDDTLASESPKPEEEPRYCKARLVINFRADIMDPANVVFPSFVNLELIAYTSYRPYFISKDRE